MFTTIRAVFGGIVLFLGRDLNFLFAGGMMTLLTLRLLPILPGTWPQWSDTALMITLALIVAVIPFINERAGYVVSGILAGGYFVADYFVPGFTSIPLLPFIVGAAFGGILLGVFADWALMIITSLIGSFYVMDLFSFDRMTEMIVSGGLFIAGALTQVILRRLQQK